MTPAQIAAVARRAGFVGGSLAVAVAVALAESSGDPAQVADIDNPHAGCRSYGLWQINYCPDRDAGTRPPPADLLDPEKNAAFAYQLSGAGNNWRPWTTYTAGTYRTHLAAAQAGIAAAPTSATLAGFWQNSPTPDQIGPGIPHPKIDGSGAAGAVIDTGAALASIASFLAGFTSHNALIRTAEIVAGLLALGLGLVILDRDLGSPVAGALKKAGTVAALA